jgi:hypothetical protein
MDAIFFARIDNTISSLQFIRVTQTEWLTLALQLSRKGTLTMYQADAIVSGPAG